VISQATLPAPEPDLDLGQPWPRRTIYSVAEYRNVDIPMEDLLVGGRLRVNPEVISRGYFNIRLQGDSLRVQAGGYVGLIPLNERAAIEVVPRVPVGNLSRILSIAGYVPTALVSERKRYELQPGPLDSVLDIYARGLVAAVDEIVTRGLYRTYRRREAMTSFPRGRILVSDTVIRLHSRGISHRASSTWFERTADNAANRCLKYAILFLARRYAQLENPRPGSRRIQRELNRAYRVFDSVTLDRTRSFMGDAEVAGRAELPRVRGYYRDALDLASAIIREQAVALDHAGEDLRLSSIVLSLQDVFEAYLRNVLRRAARADRWDALVLDGNSDGAKLLFDEGGKIAANPDIVVAPLEKRRETSVLIDAKYKPYLSDPDRDDINQVVTYGFSYRARNVVLVSPKPANRGSVGLRKIGTIKPLAVYQYVFDLGSTDLEDQEVRFAAAVASVWRTAPALPQAIQQSLPLSSPQ